MLGPDADVLGGVITEPGTEDWLRLSRSGIACGKMQALEALLATSPETARPRPDLARLG